MANPPLLLVVDDQASVRRLVETVFTRAGFRVMTAEGGEEALARVRKQMPDVVLLDMRMPGLDGLETLRRLLELAPALPVVLMTAVGDDERMAESLRLGARAAVGKPFDVFRIQEVVRSVLSQGGSA